MKIDIKIPSMGESVSEATIGTILQQGGSFVKQDSEILELETDKVNQALYAPKSGILTLTIQSGDTVKIGDCIGNIEVEENPKEIPPKKEAPLKKEIVEKLPQAREMTEEFLSPKKEERKELPPPPSSVKRKKMSSLRKIIADKLVMAKNQTAMLTTFNEVDLSRIIEIRASEKENFEKKYGVKLGFMSFFVKAVVSALKAIPEVNSYIDGEEIVTLSTYDMGIAVATDKGLMVPVIRNCDTLSFGLVEKEIERFAKKAREGTISVDDLKGGSFTITNGGRFGSLLSTPILNPPQSAILGMHTIQKRAVVVDEAIVIRPMMYLALSYDHRIIDGKEAVLFLVHVKQNLEDPSRLLLEL